MDAEALDLLKLEARAECGDELIFIMRKPTEVELPKELAA
jgi:hypothetical protein